MPNDRDIESICAAAGADIPSDTRSLSAPIYQSSVFEIDSLETIDDLYEGRAEGFLYSREANPNVAILERVIAQLEDADDSVAFASGMAAIGITLLSMVEAGDRILAGSELYGGTNLMLRQHMSKLGVETQFVDTNDLNAVEQALDSQPRLILVESIANPLLRLADIKSIGQMAHQRGVQVVVDNTLASPLLLRPLELGADVTLHSATKNLGGHSDVTGGVAAARADLTMAMRQSNRVWGSVLDPFAAWLIVRGIRTLPLRMERACENAVAVARFLSDHPKISAVHYPGLPDHPQHELAVDTLGGRFGWMVTFELAGGGSSASSFVKSLEMIKLAASLGESQTTISHPAKTSHRSLTEDEQAALGISDGLIRLSCGIESASDILADLESALAKS
ncbi:MAG: aminotransferase class I/II-fold pyridoxal phosphate-dependent enzyme [SAR202 cluster bacterium]|nr:aminotransferase class I/II-fold pyridoxal phosphate-dependent enzyme [SAR202 cluster bacterium]MDP6715374.1 aminotransferase class I/II-fold pyridoxal phosphate-dependent enzyme [SAR202 cluster bacterium]